MIAHDLKKKVRTADVRFEGDIRFDSLLLSEQILQGLNKCGFRKPSPVQALAVPVVKTGCDVLIQAKSGTGKTCVFVIAALEAVNTGNPRTQVVMLAPTREVAVQIAQTCLWMGGTFNDLKVFSFIGGLSTEDDVLKAKMCHIAVGTPGRVAWLLKNGYLNCQSAKLLVLDEADKIVDRAMVSDVEYISKRMPKGKQVVCCSATFPAEVEAVVCRLMKNPEKVKVSEDVNLMGIKQFVVRVDFHPLSHKQVQLKFRALLALLQRQSFSQCMVFSNFQMRAETLSRDCEAAGWPSACLSGHLDQMTRLKALSDLQKLNCRVLFATDVGARGIDVENVDVVVNFDVPVAPEWYLHRIGRAGRFGSPGLCFTLVSGAEEENAFQALLMKTRSDVRELTIKNLEEDLWKAESENFPAFTPEEFDVDESPPEDQAQTQAQRHHWGRKKKSVARRSPKSREEDEEKSVVGEIMKKARERMGGDWEDVLVTSEEMGTLKSWVEKSGENPGLESFLSGLGEETDFLAIFEKYRSQDGDFEGEEEAEEYVERRGKKSRKQHRKDQEFEGDSYSGFRTDEHLLTWFRDFMVETSAIRRSVFEREYEKALNEM